MLIRSYRVPLHPNQTIPPDTDHSGTMSLEELSRALTLLGFDGSEEGTGEFARQIDADGSGVIDTEEFMQVLVQKVIAESNRAEVSRAAAAACAPWLPTPRARVSGCLPAGCCRAELVARRGHMREPACILPRLSTEPPLPWRAPPPLSPARRHRASHRHARCATPRLAPRLAHRNRPASCSRCSTWTRAGRSPRAR